MTLAAAPHRGTRSAALLAVAIATACTGHARGPSLEQEVAQLKRNQAELLKRMETLERARRPDAAAAQASAREIDLAGISFLGDPDAPVTLIEFTDYQCPYCRRHAQQTLPRLRERYVETGQLRYGIREFPIERLHPDAARLSRAALCAGEQGRYWEMHERLMTSPQQATRRSVAPAVQALGLDESDFSACMEGERLDTAIRGDIAAGFHLGVRATPFFAIGRTGQDGATRLSIASTLTGARPFESFVVWIDPLVAPAAGAEE